MNTTLLISEKTLKSMGVINDNVGSEYILPAITLAQEVNLQQLIGTKLLKKLCLLVKNGSIVTVTDYKTLLDEYVTPYLLWSTTSEIQIPLSLKTTNSGSIQTNDSNRTAVQRKDVNYMADYYANKAKYFGKLLTDFLNTNMNKYPEYMRTDSMADVLASPESYCDIYLGDDDTFTKKWFKDNGDYYC